MSTIYKKNGVQLPREEWEAIEAADPFNLTPKERGLFAKAIDAIAKSIARILGAGDD